MMPPLRLQPIIKQRPWGGRQLSRLWDQSAQGDSACLRGNVDGWAESWEVVDLGADQSRIVGGKFAGKSLCELVRENSRELLGEQASLKQFPLLFKFLDAAELLSVQVHPNDEHAAQMNVGPHGKSEAWVIISAEPGSKLSVGLMPGVDRRLFEQHLASGTVAECLNTFEARVGDVISVPAGTVHAIGGGIALAEIQQPSDITFRLFDWNRLDADGHRRALHINEALQCIDFSRQPESSLLPRLLDPQLFAANALQAGGSTRHEELIYNEHFLWRRHQLNRASFKLTDCGRCRILSLIAGSVELSSPMSREQLLPGNTLLLPANGGTVELTSAADGLLLEALSVSN